VRELSIKDEERKTAEVIAVQVSYKDGVNVVRVDSRALERYDRRCAAVEKA
jgi:hypothetical protein